MLCYMELPNLLNKFAHSQETQKKEYFWAIEIWEKVVKSAIWVVEGGRAKTVALGSDEIWEETVDELVNAVDKSLSTASERFLGEAEEPVKVLFGLPPGWLEEKEITASRRQMLQTLCERLNISPLGYVLTIDAINHRLKEVEGVPPSVILVNPQKNQVVVAVLEVGKVKKTEEVKRSENLAADVYEGLLRFEEMETLPARILLFNGEDMESARQILISFPWQQETDGRKLPFLHFPKIEILPQDFDITAVCSAGGEEVFKKSPAALSEPIVDFGFIHGKDIREGKQEAEEVEKKIPENQHEETAVAEEEMTERSEPVEMEIEETAGSAKRKFPSFSLPVFSRLPLIGVIAGGIILVLGAVAIGLLWYLPKAEITFYVTPKILEKEFKLIVDPNQEVMDEQNLILPGQLKESEADGEKSQSTTGKKTVGDRAQGEVIIFNTGGPKNLPEGTVFTGSGKLKFTLDRSVTVASGSGAAKASQVKVPVTAVDIGAEYNLAADSEFTVANFDTSVIQAKNDSAFTGGTSRQIQAVSEEDQDNLLSALTEELENQIKADFFKNLPSGQKLIEESVLTEEVVKKFDRKIGDEAQTLNLSLRIKLTGLVFSEGEFLNLAEKELAGSVPDGYEARRGEINSKFEIKEKDKDGSISLNVFLSANLVPELDPVEIAQKIKGKNLSLAREYFSTLPGYVGSEIKITPQFPAWLLTLPRMEKNIRIEVRSQ